MLRLSFKPAWIAVLTCSILLLQAFAVNRGVDVFEIYLNNKLLLQHAANKPFTLQSLQLNKSNINDELVIYYNHCGESGRQRSIAIRDDKGNTIKEWKFADANEVRSAMRIPVKELLQLDKTMAHNSFTIFYSAQQLPKGRILSAVKLS
jgi:hypothetical protein